MAVIAYATNITDHTFSNVNGKSEQGRAFILNQSTGVASQRTLANVTAKVSSYDSAVGGLTAAVTISRGGIYRNINLDITDRSSYQALRLAPYDGTYNGQILNSTFKVTSYNSDTYAVECKHDNNANTKYENNNLTVISKNANFSDASANPAVLVKQGSNWNINLNVEYPAGKTNADAAVRLGSSGTANEVVSDSRVYGIINGGDINIQLANTDRVSLDGLHVINSEEANNINIDITSGASDTRLGTIIRDGEIQDLGTKTERDMYKLFSSTTEVATSGTSETDLITYTLQEDWMGKTGVIHLRAMGEITGSAGNKTITFYFGTQSRNIISTSNVTGDWCADVWVWQDGTRAEQKILVHSAQGNATGIVTGKQSKK